MRRIIKITLDRLLNDLNIYFKCGGNFMNKLYSKSEEMFNTISHAVGALLGLVYMIYVLLMYNSILNTDEIGALIIFCLSIINLYTMSSMYHIINDKKLKKVFRIFDHCSIFILIAGTYTPYIILKINTSLGHAILFFVWFCALIGIVMNAINMESKIVKLISYIFYLLMGWCIIFIYNQLIISINNRCFIYLLVGGIIYTIGFVFYALGKKKKWFHSIWHLFVLGGTIFHFISVINLII